MRNADTNARCGGEKPGVEADGPPVAADGDGAGPDELARREAFDEAVADDLELVHAADGYSVRRPACGGGAICDRWEVWPRPCAYCVYIYIYDDGRKFKNLNNW